jgi:hypothetical protein
MLPPVRGESVFTYHDTIVLTPPPRKRPRLQAFKEVKAQQAAAMAAAAQQQGGVQLTPMGYPPAPSNYPPAMAAPAPGQPPANYPAVPSSSSAYVPADSPPKK